MIEASSLLSAGASRDRVIELFREVLIQDPSHRMSRLWLARVLSWGGHYDESLREYGEIAERESDPHWAQKESADVLTWSGRYEEAFPIYCGSSVTNRTTPEEVGTAAALAREHREWLILMLHFLVEEPTIETEYSIESFKRILRAVADTGIKVLPLTEVFGAGAAESYPYALSSFNLGAWPAAS
jgi:hypothetical protein